MPRCIDAELLFTDIQKYLCASCSIHCNPSSFKNSACDIAECLRMIDNAPTTDVQEIKHGRWENDYCFWLKCSVCQKQNDDSTPYCPYCGAIMDGGDDNE